MREGRSGREGRREEGEEWTRGESHKEEMRRKEGEGVFLERVVCKGRERGMNGRGRKEGIGERGECMGRECRVQKGRERSGQEMKDARELNQIEEGEEQFKFFPR